MKQFLFPAVLILGLFTVNRASSQWITDAQIVGATLGVEFENSSLMFGANGEYGVNDDIGVGATLRYWSHSFPSGAGGETITNKLFMIGVQGNYHFIPRTSKLDPFVGILIGYKTGSVSTTQQVGATQQALQHDDAGALVAIQAAARYFLNPSMAIVGKLTLGSLSFTAFEAGVDFRL